jgi:hypothetical protein
LEHGQEYNRFYKPAQGSQVPAMVIGKKLKIREPIFNLIFCLHYEHPSLANIFNSLLDLALENIYRFAQLSRRESIGTKKKLRRKCCSQILSKK